jgi:DNA-binding YbaB/EbfC family protein
VNIQKMMKQVQEAQAKMAEMQGELARKTVEATAGGGMVKVVCGGDGTLRSITIDPEVVNASEIDMLQDLIVAAVNEGKRKASELVSQEMRKAAGSLGLPPGLV